MAENDEEVFLIVEGEKTPEPGDERPEVRAFSAETQKTILFCKYSKAAKLYDGQIGAHEDEAGAAAELIGYITKICHADREAALMLFMESKLSSIGEDEAGTILERAIVAYEEPIWFRSDIQLIAKSLPIKMLVNPRRLAELMEYFKTNMLYSHDEKGLGRLISDLFSRMIRFNVTSKCWYRYDGRAWTPDECGVVADKLAKTFADAIKMFNAYAGEVYDHDLIKKLGDRSKRTSIINDAKSEQPFSKDDLDAHPELFNVENGTLNLNTFKLQPHNPDDMLSKVAAVRFDEHAKGELWRKVVSDVMQGDAQKSEYMQRVFGYALTPDTHEECMFILYGRTTRNGKTTVMETICSMMGNAEGYAMTIQPETLAVRKLRNGSDHTEDIARLEGSRLVSCPEPSKGMLFDAKLIKDMTGGDMINARALRESSREFRPTFKIIVNTNHLPALHDDTVFAGRRIQVLTFDRRFTEAEQDLHLKSKLRDPKELSGVLNWCLEGLLHYREQGLNPPPCVVDATNEYRSRADVLFCFMSDCMVPCEGATLPVKEVFDEYANYCDSSGYLHLSKSNFIEEIKTRGLYMKRKTIAGKDVKHIMTGYYWSRD